MRALFLLLSLALGPASAWAKQGECNLARREYERMIAPLPQKCSSPSECMDYHVLWSECESPRYHSRDALDDPGAAALRTLRERKKTECGWIEPPCAAIPQGEVLCLKGQCSSTDEFFAAQKGALRLKFVDATTGKPVAGTEATVLAGHIIYCVTTPCPEGRKVQVLKTDAAGVLALPRSLLEGKISIRLKGSVDGKSKSRDLEELSLSSLITLSLSEIRL